MPVKELLERMTVRYLYQIGNQPCDISLSFASSVCAISQTDATVTTSPYDFSVNTQIGSRKYHSYQCFQP